MSLILHEPFNTKGEFDVEFVAGVRAVCWDALELLVLQGILNELLCSSLVCKDGARYGVLSFAEKWTSVRKLDE